MRKRTKLYDGLIINKDYYFEQDADLYMKNLKKKSKEQKKLLVKPVAIKTKIG